MAQGAEVIERHARVGRQPVALADLAKKLRLADAVDPQIALQVGIELHDLRGVARLLDNEVDEESLQVRAGTPLGRWLGKHRGVDGRRMAVGSMAIPLVAVRRMPVGQVTVGAMAIRRMVAARGGRGGHVDGGGPGRRGLRLPPDARQHVAEEVPEGAEVIERHA